MADSASGAYALGKATNPDVKAFAKLMMGEHHALRVQGQQLAKQLNVTPAPPADDSLKPAVASEMAALDFQHGHGALDGQDLAFLVGGPEGHPPGVLAAKDTRVSLGKVSSVTDRSRRTS